MNDAAAPHHPVGRDLELVEAFPLRPIRDDAQLAAATAVMRTLTDRAEGQLSTDESDYLDVLSDLVLAYEEAEHPIPRATQAHIVRDLMEDQGVTQAQVAAGTGISVPNVSSILAGRRAISKSGMIALGRFFDGPPGRFLVG